MTGISTTRAVERCGRLATLSPPPPCGWSEASQHVADEWLDEAGPWIIEGVAASRALRKWRDAHPGEPPPIDRVIYLGEPHEALTPGQATMAKGVRTVHDEIEPWLAENGIVMEYLSSTHTT